MRKVLYRTKIILRELLEIYNFILTRFLLSPFFFFGLSFIFITSIGIVIVFNYGYSYSFIFLIIIFLLTVFLKRKFKKNLWFYLLFVIVLVGVRLLLSYSYEKSITNKYDGLKTNFVSLNVTIIKPPDVNNDYVRYTVENNSDKLLLSVMGSRYPVYIPYSKCSLEGKVTKITKDSQYFTYYYSKDIFYDLKVSSFSCVDDHSSLFWSLYAFKHSTFSVIEQNMNEPYASLLIGILWGENRSFSPKMDEAFKITGTTHVIAASGYNVNVIASILNVFLQMFVRKIKIVLSIFILLLYLFLAGISASILRAVLMYVIDRVYELFGVPVTIFHIIVLTVVVVMLYNPKVIYDVGFQLSLGATLGLVFFSKVFSNDLPLLPESLSNTLSANIGTIGITAYAFGTFSLISIPVNAIVLSFLDNIMEFGMIGIGTFYISKVISRVIFMFVEDLLKPFVYITYSFTQFRSLYLQLNTMSAMVLIIIMGLITIIFILRYFIILIQDICNR